MQPRTGLRHLQSAGLRLLARNYRTPGRGGGEIDLVMRDFDGTLVFVEVRARRPGGTVARRPASGPSSAGASCWPRATT
jgi:Holliday junction resolvase-like predicted endonuclease